MGYLGLDETAVKDDNLFQRLFWPSDHAGETDALGKQGFWVCMLVALASFLILMVQGHWALALLQMAFYALGGIGVREHSVASATLVAVAYWVNIAYGFMAGQPSGIIPLGAGVLLIANIRGTFIAARWAKRGDPDAFPERRSSTLAERFVDQMPVRAWPRVRVLFFCLAGVYMLLTAAGTWMLLAHMQSAGRSQGSQTIHLEPSR